MLGRSALRTLSSLRSIAVSRMALTITAPTPTTSSRGNALREGVPRPWRPMARSTTA